MSAAVVAVLGIVAVAALAYLERKVLKAEVVAIKAKAFAEYQRYADALRSKESLANDVAKIAADIKAWETKEGASAKEVIAQFEARLKQII